MTPCTNKRQRFSLIKVLLKLDTMPPHKESSPDPPESPAKASSSSTTMTVPPEKVGSENSTLSIRSGVMLMPDAAKSHFPVCTADSIPSKFISTISIP